MYYPLGNLHWPSADSIGFRILNKFNTESWPTITESVVQSADSVVQSVNSTADSSSDLARIGVWVWALREIFLICKMFRIRNLTKYLRIDNSRQSRFGSGRAYL